MEYIGSFSAGKILGLVHKYLIKLVENKTLTNYATGKEKWKFSKDEVIKLKTLWDKEVAQTREIYMTYKEAAEFLNYCPSYMSSLVNSKAFSHKKILHGVGYVLKEEVLSYKSYIETIKNNYFESDEAASILGYSINGLRYAMKNKNLFPNSIYFKYRLYIPKEDVKQYASFLQNCMTVNEATQYLNVSATKIRKLIKKKLFPNFIFNKASNSYLIPKSDLINYQNHLKIKEEYRVISDPNVAFDYFLHILLPKLPDQNKYPLTLDLYCKFTKIRLKTSKAQDLKRESHRLFNPLIYMLNNIGKEIHLYTDDEIKDFFQREGFISSHGLEIKDFLKFCRSKLRGNCGYSIEVYRKSNYNPKKDRAIYSKEKFIQYYLYCSDIKRHTINAISGINGCLYAQLWIYVMMHFTNAWRAGDIVSLPNVNLEEINIDNLEWFYNSELTDTQAQIIVNQYYNNEFLVSKTGVSNRFTVNDDLIKPFATALVIAELYRRRLDEDYLLFRLKERKPRGNTLKTFFYDSPDLIDFSNRKANRTFLTYFYEFVKQSGEVSILAYELAHNLRRHKGTNTTSIYLQEINKDIKAEHICLHIFRRGNFGWLYNKMLELAGNDGNFNELTLNEKTAMIEGLERSLSPIQLESVNKLFMNQQYKRKTVIQEITAMPKETLHAIISKVQQGSLPAKVPEAQCFMHGKCTSPPASSCSNCIYIIPNRYFLIGLKKEIYNIIYKIRDTAQYSFAEYKKLETMLYQRMLLLREAIDVDTGYGATIVDAFIDRNELSKAISDTLLNIERQC